MVAPTRFRLVGVAFVTNAGLPPIERRIERREASAGAGEVQDIVRFLKARRVAVDERNRQRAIQRGRARDIDLIEEGAGGGAADLDRQRACRSLRVGAVDGQGSRAGAEIDFARIRQKVAYRPCRGRRACRPRCRSGFRWFRACPRSEWLCRRFGCNRRSRQRQTCTPLLIVSVPALGEGARDGVKLAPFWIVKLPPARVGDKAGQRVGRAGAVAVDLRPGSIEHDAGGVRRDIGADQHARCCRRRLPRCRRSMFRSRNSYSPGRSTCRRPWPRSSPRW